MTIELDEGDSKVCCGKAISGSATVHSACSEDLPIIVEMPHGSSSSGTGTVAFTYNTRTDLDSGDCGKEITFTAHSEARCGSAAVTAVVVDVELTGTFEAISVDQTREVGYSVKPDDVEVTAELLMEGEGKAIFSNGDTSINISNEGVLSITGKVLSTAVNDVILRVCSEMPFSVIKIEFEEVETDE